jgi:hypothetical protein
MNIPRHRSKTIETSSVIANAARHCDLDACPPGIALAGLASRSGRSQVPIRYLPLSAPEATVHLVVARRTQYRSFGSLFLATLLIPAAALAQAPIASSQFVGVESPLYENGAWVALTSLAPQGCRFQKNNGAFPDRLVGPDHNHAGARTTAAIPTDQYAEIVVGHLGNSSNNVGPTVRVQASGASVDSHYLWWASNTTGINSLYRIDANGTSYTGTPLIASSPVTDRDTLRLIARGQVIYGLKNGVRDFIYNTGTDRTKYPTGTAGMLAYPSTTTLTDAMIASWSSGGAPASSGSWDSSNFAGTENPLDEGDRWYPLPGYSGFRKAGGLAIGRDLGNNAEGVWSITPPARQYSEVTLGTAAKGGGGPVVRIDRSNPGQTGWLLFLYVDNPMGSGIFKMNPDGTFTSVRSFTPIIVTGDKWRLTADGNTLTVSQNGVSQFAYTTDGSYPAGDVGIQAQGTAFTFMGWQGGDVAGPPPPPPTAPGSLTAVATSGREIDLVWTASTSGAGVTGYQVERCQGALCANFAQIATVTGTTFNNTGLAPSTSYSYRVRATDAAGNLSPYSNVASATTLMF